MSKEPDNLVLEHLRLIRADIGTMKAEIKVELDVLNHKIGSMAETLVGIKRDIHVLQGQVSALEVSVHGIRQDIATLAIAVDEHTHRLDRIEKRLGLVDA